ncbi:MAG: 5'-methylthioadenosine/adenosylhomocysteine nucleosidase [Candidatus Stahlbacteria bacterium]|nr:MAG: 5'-methylthioadenosine/adenosylhomocysteine nucleosidase [Candidatus Stahlbacteria bacterium]
MMTTLIILLLSLNQPEPIGIISAMDEELALIKEDMVIETVDTVSNRIFTIGKIYGMPCVCVKAGIGKVNAAMTAEILILNYNVECVICNGVAGGIDPNLDIGDIIISKKIIHHDFGQLMTDTFIPFDTLGFLADKYLIDIAVKAAANAKFDPVPQEICKKTGHFPDVIVGRIVTGDQFISSEKKRKWIERTFHADCVEMEGAAVAQVCVINQVPFVIIRCLSDIANETADIDFEEFVVYAAKNSSLIVNEMIKLLKK